MTRFSRLSTAGRIALVCWAAGLALGLAGLLVPGLEVLVWGGPGLSLAALAPFPIDPDRQAVAIAYRTKGFIADDVLPRVMVMKQEYTYYEWNKAEQYRLPDTKVGRASAPNRVEFSATETTGRCLDYGLDNPIPLADIQNAPDGIDPRDHGVETIMSLVERDREVRVAGVVFAPATYPAGNKVQLSGTSQFSDFTNSDPLDVLSTGLDVPLIRPNTAVIGQLVWTKLRRHPDLVKAMHGTAGDTGMITRQFLAELLEIERVLVGNARVDTSKKGQASAFSRAWGKHIALLHVNTLARPTVDGSTATFGFTAQWGPRIAGTEQDRNIGLRGGEVVRAGESVDEHVVASDLGYFVEDAVA